MSYKIAVLGAGSWGTALSVVAAHNNDVTIWNAFDDVLIDIRDNKENSKYLPGVKIENVKVESDIQKAVEGKDIILMVIPSKFFRDVLQQFAPYTKVRSCWEQVVGKSLLSSQRLSSLMLAKQPYSYRKTQIVHGVI